jgi:histidine ammonia-lyase
MGANSALMTANVIENTFEICSIQLLAVLQAIDYLGIQDKMSTFNKAFYKTCRVTIPKVTEDKPSFVLLREIKSFLKKSTF